MNYTVVATVQGKEYSINLTYQDGLSTLYRQAYDAISFYICQQLAVHEESVNTEIFRTMTYKMV